MYFVIQADTYTEAIEVAKGRMKELKGNLKTKFKYLRNKCVLTKKKDFIQNTFPSYNFLTGEILLRDGQVLASFVKSPTKRVNKDSK